MSERFVILCDVRSSHNVGAIFRTADAVGVSKIYLGGYTPAPVDRFGRVNEKLLKTALGATSTVLWEQVPDTPLLLSTLSSRDVTLVAVEQTPQSVLLFSYTPRKNTPIAYIFGNEITGLAPEICKASDTVVELPMLGQKESLNVAVTAGVVLYHDARLRLLTKT
jgi:tRNA G18 (ribose-2'-O)-methylase SpoU